MSASAPVGELDRWASTARNPTVLELMSGFELRHGGKPVLLPLSAQRLVAFLALQDRPLLRLYVAGTLWLHTSEARANASLRSALWRLQRHGSCVVCATSRHLSLAPAVEVDVRRAAASAHRVMRARTALEPADAHEVRRSGELLPDWYDDWLVVERERFRQLRLHALESLADRLAAEHRYGEAVEIGLIAVAAEPLRESAHRAVITIHLAEGNVGEAIRQYEAYRVLVDRQLGIGPSEGLRRLVDVRGVQVQG